MAQWSCKQKGCSVASSGRCVDGIEPPSGCPHIVQVAAGKATASTKAAGRTLRLPGGGVLDFDQATSILRAEPGKILLVAGAQRSGKTTLPLAIYELFNKGPFAGLHFAGSETLFAFESMCHAARVRSENDSPDTLRTEFEAGTHFLHLRLIRDGDARQPFNLLFADLSGEHYENACNSTDDCKKIPMLRRADRVLLMLDGKRLKVPAERAKVFKEARGMLGSALDAEMLTASSQVRVLFAKWDLLADDTAAQSPLHQIEDRLAAEFRGRVARFEFAKVAARPELPTAAVPLGHGLAEILGDASLPPEKPVPLPLRLPVPVSDRQADRYLSLRLPDLCKEVKAL
jgi:hypothetical protein